jgi:hypothetical protein
VRFFVIAVSVRHESEVTMNIMEQLLGAWLQDPVAFVRQAIGARPDPWQCDVLTALLEHDNVALRAAHGVGKTTLLAWAILWFLVTRPRAKVPITAPTFNKQVRDILWAEVHHAFRRLSQQLPPLAREFELHTTRLRARSHPQEWFAVGVPSAEALNIEGYHSPHLLAVFDEAKGVPARTWEAVHGMRTTQEAKLLVASTPGGPGSEFHRVFTRYRATWRSLFVIRPEALITMADMPGEAPSPARTYYSTRVRTQCTSVRRSGVSSRRPLSHASSEISLTTAPIY